MKKVLLATLVAFCFAGQSFAQQEQTGGNQATNSATGNIANTTIVASAVGVGLVAAVVANNRGNVKAETVEPIECGAGEELVNGVCVPVSTSTTATSTVTATNTVTSTVTNTVTSTMTTPVTVTATTTAL
ncbi:hypothetical protein RS130_21370 [Paraglaciecola aquimarina]|uniref:Secreted protein n=1 Tax=Paraglaciecola aquimarina TaxID=1235557 RepID=A0ABU3T1H6_9ALTE|nr:hypothetical protein [Paraglaciecola aquimarina]MDU0356100.1 hypothetical protein [Paraglaciecola aquimarina]